MTPSFESLMDEPIVGYNSIFVKNFILAVIVKPIVFYSAFTRKDMVKNGLDFILSIDDKHQYPSSFKSINYIEKTNGSKLLRGYVFEIPECKTDHVDCKYLAIAYQERVPAIYTCEYMEGELYCLRENDEAIIHLFEHIPTALEVWNVIDEKTGEVEGKEKIFSILYNASQNTYIYSLAVPSVTEFNKAIFEVDTAEMKPFVFNGKKYLIQYSDLSENFIVYRDNNGVPDHVEVGDEAVVEAYLSIGK